VFGVTTLMLERHRANRRTASLAETQATCTAFYPGSRATESRTAIATARPMASLARALPLAQSGRACRNALQSSENPIAGSLGAKSFMHRACWSNGACPGVPAQNASLYTLPAAVGASASSSHQKSTYVAGRGPHAA
jgi:hypothetical protein